MIKKITITFAVISIIFFSCTKNITNTKNTSSIALKEETQFTSTSEPTIFEKAKECPSSRLAVYLNDPDTSGTNIRRTPKGKIIAQLIKDDVNFEYSITVTEVTNGWFKIESPIVGIENDIEIPEGEGWIHGSVISVDTRNYNNEHINLLENPKDGKILKTIKEGVSGLTLKDFCGDWVQIQYQDTIGWVEREWLCGNPLTNCS